MRKRNENGEIIDGIIFTMIIALAGTLFAIVFLPVVRDVIANSDEPAKIVSEYVLQEVKNNPTFTGFNAEPDGINIATILQDKKVTQLKCGTWKEKDIDESQNSVSFTSKKNCVIRVKGNWKSFSINGEQYYLTINGEYILGKNNH